MPPKKKILAVVKIQLPAGGATPAPPVGTALGPHGVQTMEFCKQYNAATENQRGTVVPVEITHLRGPVVLLRPEDPAHPVLIRQAAGIEKGAADGRPGSRRARSPTPRSTEIATVKLPDLNTDDIEAAKRQVAGTARSMGIAVRG